MYSAQYGYPSGSGGSSFNGAPPPHNPHLQPGPPQNPQQQQQHMMYNPQQYPVGAQSAGFPTASNQAMMGGVGSAGSMQSAATMPHMTANSPVTYQAPFTSSPYGPNVTSSVAPQPQLPPSYRMPNSMPNSMPNPMPQYQMNQAGMSQQQMMPRMHPSQHNASTMSPQRTLNALGTPTNGSAQPFPSSQPQGPAQIPTPTIAQQQVPSVTTPQTPTFPPASSTQTNGTSALVTPLSPGTESKDKERFALLLEINQELLLESMQMQNTRAELKKEMLAENSADKKSEFEEQDKMASVDYHHCMRRLQGNLAYMATLADRKSAHPLHHPAQLTAPPMNLSIRLRGEPVIAVDQANPQPIDAAKDRDQRDRYLKELYKNLQALFPGVDPKKEYPHPGTTMRPGTGQQPPQAGGKIQNGHQTGSNHSSPAPGTQLQKTPQMAHVAIPSVHGQPSGA